MPEKREKDLLCTFMVGDTVEITEAKGLGERFFVGKMAFVEGINETFLKFDKIVYKLSTFGSWDESQLALYERCPSAKPILITEDNEVRFLTQDKLLEIKKHAMLTSEYIAQTVVKTAFQDMVNTQSTNVENEKSNNPIKSILDREEIKIQLDKPQNIEAEELSDHSETENLIQHEDYSIKSNLEVEEVKIQQDNSRNIESEELSDLFMPESLFQYEDCFIDEKPCMKIKFLRTGKIAYVLQPNFIERLFKITWKGKIEKAEKKLLGRYDELLEILKYKKLEEKVKKQRLI